MRRCAYPLVLTLILTISLASRGVFATQYDGKYLFALPNDFGLSVGNLNSSSVFGGQVVGRTSIVGADDATIWYAPTGAFTDLHPSGFWYSEANGTDGIRQVGSGIPGNPGENLEHALVWTGTAASVVDLHPSSYYRSVANDVSGSEQVGYGTIPPGFISHALLWHGSADSVVDLHPLHLPAYGSSQAVSTDGIQQVGHAASNSFHAALWSGSAISFIDLHPTSGYVDSSATDVMNGQQVGYGDISPTWQRHALLWTGSAESVIDLNPTNLSPWGYLGSAAYGTNGVQQVGWGQPWTSESTFGGPRALLWNGTAASAVDLHAVLPLGFDESQAFSIDVDGVVWGIARDKKFRWHAVMWTPVPEPTSLAAIAVGSVLLALRRGRIAPTADAAQ